MSGLRAPMGISWPVWRLAGVVVLGALLSMLDTSIVNVGLATVAEDLDADLSDAQWVASAYLLALAVSLPLCGWLGRRIGVGRLWLGALAGFVAASALCALAPDLGWLIALRVLQGLAAGLLVPAGQTILGQAVGPGRLGRVMAVLGIAVGFGPAFGPALGGLILSTASWPWLFWLNVPLGAIGLVAGRRLIPRGRAQPTERLDRPGLALVSVGLPATVYALTRWGELGQPAPVEVLLPLVIGIVALVGFVLRSRRSPHPLTDLDLFRRPVYAAAAVATTFTGAAMFGALLLLPLFLQLGRGAGVVETGLSLIAYGAGTALTVPLAGMLTDRCGGGVVAVIGGVATVATTAPFALVGLDVHPALLQGLLLARGMAIGLIAIPPTVAAYAAVRAEQLPDATTQINVVQRIGGAVGGALFAVVLAAALPLGPATAVATAFWWLTAASGLALAAALVLWRTESRGARNPWGARSDAPPPITRGR